MIKAFYPGENQRYDFDALIKVEPDLEKAIILNKAGESTIDFSDSNSIILLNKALLNHYFGIKHWNLGREFLCPPIPGRAHYIYHLKELIPPEEANILDIGTGANVIYPLLGVSIFNWSFVGSDIEPEALDKALQIINANGLEKKISLRLQNQKSFIFHGIIQADEYFDAVVCNPPFYRDEQAAKEANTRKDHQLHGALRGRNFGGKSHEIIFPGGEFQFANNMIFESSKFKKQVGWFTCLISKGKHLKNLIPIIEKHGDIKYKIIDMAQGKKASRILAWTFKK